MTFRPDAFAALAAERNLRLGRPTLFRSVTTSTNDDALAGAREGAPDGALYVAETQTAGRGRRGNRWYGAPGESLAFTLLLRPRVPASRASALALVGGLGVRAAAGAWLRAAGQDEPVLVKWPNDVVVGGRKLCGILAESQIRGSEIVAVALGIGLNVGISGLPNDLAETATSLLALGVRTPVAESLIADILTELAPRIEGFLAGGESTVTEFRLHDALIGRRVRIGSLEGVCRGINRSGSLLLQDEKAEKDEKAALKEVISGHVEMLNP
jgi:BirA family transcriptional regulator, biotin operon repressor / biotin---[acetyl-CoA-carboxylase] ligase